MLIWYHFFHCYTSIHYALPVQQSQARGSQWQGSFQELLTGPSSPQNRQRQNPQSDRDPYSRHNRHYDDFRQRPERNMHDANLPGKVFDDNSRPVSFYPDQQCCLAGWVLFDLQGCWPVVQGFQIVFQFCCHEMLLHGTGSLSRHSVLVQIGSADFQS